MGTNPTRPAFSFRNGLVEIKHHVILQLPPIHIPGGRGIFSISTATNKLTYIPVGDVCARHNIRIEMQ